MADILIIDDDPDFRRFVAQTLSAVGHQISEAKAGIDGVAAFHARHPGLVITDIVQSGKVEAIHELRREAPDLKIVAVSSSIRPEFDLYIATSLGANAVVKKSFCTLELLSIVAKLLPWQEETAIPLAA
jgi:two-component system, OmpR family, KDP operon response regulator KdpE